MHPFPFLIRRRDLPAHRRGPTDDRRLLCANSISRFRFKFKIQIYLEIRAVTRLFVERGVPTDHMGPIALRPGPHMYSGSPFDDHPHFCSVCSRLCANMWGFGKPVVK